MATDLVPFVGSDALTLERLRQHAEHVRGAYATNTERTLRADIAAFTAWCARAALPALPATAGTVAAFIDAMADDKAPATIRRYVSSIATFHRAAGLESPSASLEVQMALKRLHRAKGRAQAQATGLTRRLVDRMLDVPGSGPRYLRNRALLAVAYDALLRRGELIALELADLEYGNQGDGTVIVRRTESSRTRPSTLRIDGLNVRSSIAELPGRVRSSMPPPRTQG